MENYSKEILIENILDELREEGEASVEGFDDDTLEFSIMDIKKVLKKFLK